MTGKRKPHHVDGNNDEDTSKWQKTAKPVVSKEQAITASLETLLKLENLRNYTPIGFITEDPLTVVEFAAHL